MSRWTTRVRCTKAVKRKRSLSSRQVKRAKEAVVNYLRAGVTISTACKLAGVARRTFYHWLAKDEFFALSVDEAEASAIAKAELNIANAIAENDVKVSMWYLERRCPEYRRQPQESAEDDDYELELEVAPGVEGTHKVLLVNGKQERTS